MMSSPSVGTNNSILESKIDNIDSRVFRLEEKNIQLEEENQVNKAENKVIKEKNIQLEEYYVNLKRQIESEHQQKMLIRKLQEYYRIYLTVKYPDEFNKYCELLKKYKGNTILNTKNFSNTYQINLV